MVSFEERAVLHIFQERPGGSRPICQESAGEWIYRKFKLKSRELRVNTLPAGRRLQPERLARASREFGTGPIIAATGATSLAEAIDVTAISCHRAQDGSSESWRGSIQRHRGRAASQACYIRSCEAVGGGLNAITMPRALLRHSYCRLTIGAFRRDPYRC